MIRSRFFLMFLFVTIYTFLKACAARSRISLFMNSGVPRG